MAYQRITREDLFPNGTSVVAYPLSNWSQAVRPPSGAPVAPSTTSATMTAGVAYLTGLVGRTDYVAYGLVSGEHRYLNFKTAPDVVFGGQTEVAVPYEPLHLARSALLQVALRGTLLGFTLPKDVVISRLVLNVTVAATVDDPCDVGLYDAAGNRMLSSGATSGLMNGVTGRKTVTIAPTQLRADTKYFVAFAYGTAGGTAATMTTVSYGALAGTNWFGAAFPEREVDVKGSMYPLPASWGAFGGAASAATAVLLGQ